MSMTNLQTDTESEDKSLLRLINLSSDGGSNKLESKKFPSDEFPSGVERKKGTSYSKIPRPPLAASFSFNETLKGNQTKDKTKRAPSMIPRSKSRMRNESEKVQFDIPSRTESVKNQSNLSPVPSKKQSNVTPVSSKNQLIGDLLAQEPADATPIVLQELEEKNLGGDLRRVSSSSVKSCEDFGEVTDESSDTSFKDTRDEPEPDRESSKEAEASEDEEVDPVTQERTIRNLYETIKSTVGPALDPKPETEVPELGEFDDGSEPEFASVQARYDYTLKEISHIWKNTVGFIGSVRSHAVEYVEENSKTVDEEQLTLEAEMLQLALDFAISYSKLKTDFLVRSVRERTNAKDVEKSELETFMDSKTFGALYNNEDLAAMARTVQDLNTSLVRNEDLELLE